MKRVTVNGKKAYARINGKFMTIYPNLLDYILEIPDTHLMYVYSRENNVDTVLDRLFRRLGD